MTEEEGVIEESGGAPVEGGAPLWTVTFGDMMSLLLTFFILMFSMSELKMDRFMLASQSMREAIGGTAQEVDPEAMGLMPEEVDPELELEDPGPADGSEESEDETGSEAGSDQGPWLESFIDAYTDMIARRLNEFIVERELEGTLSVHQEGEGVYLRIQSSALFGSGSAVVQDDSRWIVRELAEITREIEIRVIVSGHADNQPIRSSQFPSNWELSAARSAGVARFMVDGGHDPELIRVESFGEFRPVASNGTPGGRAQNRRVEIFYSRDDIVRAAERWAEAAVLPPDYSEDTLVVDTSSPSL